jgi:hypothetical protein
MAKNNIPTYQITIDPAYAENGEDLGIEQIAFTATPAIKVKGPWHSVLKLSLCSFRMN